MSAPLRGSSEVPAQLSKAERAGQAEETTDVTESNRSANLAETEAGKRELDVSRSLKGKKHVQQRRFT